MRAGWILLLPLFASAVGPPPLDGPQGFEAAVDRRYAPFSDWRAELGQTRPAQEDDGTYWRPAEVIRAGRETGAPGLAGLRLVLDPGHLGGPWAKAEGRSFRIQEDDFPVREGDLVLEVARRVRDALEALGASVMLTRDGSEPVSRKRPRERVPEVLERMPLPDDASLASLADYLLRVRREVLRLSLAEGELLARARLINETLRPDAVVSLHINAARWPETEDGSLRLVESDHLHGIIFGCVTADEFSRERQRKAMVRKLGNGSGPEEEALAGALVAALAEATGLPPSQYDGRNAVALDGKGYVWARNLLLLREVDCPVVLLEPYVANSRGAYARIQQALAIRAAGREPGDDDILVEYAEAVVEGVLRHYGPGDKMEGATDKTR